MPISAGGWFEEPEFRYCTIHIVNCINTFFARTDSNTFVHSAQMNACDEKQGVHKPQMNLRFKNIYRSNPDQSKFVRLWGVTEAENLVILDIQYKAVVRSRNNRCVALWAHLRCSRYIIFDGSIDVKCVGRGAS
jgi:hypothetical protein